MAKVGHVIVDRKLENIPLVSTILVFTCSIACHGHAMLVLVYLTGGVMVWNGLLGWQVRHSVFVVRDPVLALELAVREFVVRVVTYSRHSKVGHGSRDIVTEKSHSCKLSESCSKTVAGRFDLVARELLLESLDFCLDSWVDRINCSIEAFMHFTFA